VSLDAGSIELGKPLIDEDVPQFTIEKAEPDRCLEQKLANTPEATFSLQQRLLGIRFFRLLSLGDVGDDPSPFSCDA